MGDRGPLRALAVTECESDGVRGEDRGDRQQEDDEGHGSNDAALKILPRVAVMTWCVDFLPMLRHDVRMPAQPIAKVAVVVQDGAEPFGLGSLVEVWGEPDHPEDRTPVFED